MAEVLPPPRLSDIRAFEREWIALRECVSPWSDKERLRQYFPGVDWARLLLLAREHGVVGQLAACLNDPDAPIIPSEIKQALLERQRQQNFLTLRLTGELFRLLELFNRSEIRALVIKGPVLAAQAYGDPSLRSYGDLDLLVRQRDIRRASELMIASGYQAAVSLDAIRAGKTPGQYLFCKPDSKLLVEFHNDSTLRYFPRHLPIEDFFACQIRVRLDAHEVPAPSLEDHLVLICVHGAKHFWERLSLIVDVAGFVAQQTSISWERAGSSAKAVKSEHLLHTGLRLAMDVLRVKLPEPIAAGVRGDAVAERLAGKVLGWLPAAGDAPTGVFERAAFRLRMRGNFLAAPGYLLRLSFSPTEEDWQASGQGSDNSLLDALRRPFRLARKYGRHSKP
jgi:Uncharacterised nucleotidyltransferase